MKYTNIKRKFFRKDSKDRFVTDFYFKVNGFDFEKFYAFQSVKSNLYYAVCHIANNDCIETYLTPEMLLNFNPTAKI